MDTRGAQPIPRAGRPNDIAELALWLASDRSTFVTGQAMVVDGGAATGVPWSEQREVYRTYRPTKVYRRRAADPGRCDP